MLKNLESTIGRKQLRIKGGGGHFKRRPKPDVGRSATDDDGINRHRSAKILVK
jgi:hypothetical protein